MQDVLVGVDICRAAVDYCRAALARGPLIQDGNTWRYGRRRFSNETVKRLIDQGIAFRDGSLIRASEIGVSVRVPT